MKYLIIASCLLFISCQKNETKNGYGIDFMIYSESKEKIIITVENNFPSADSAKAVFGIERFQSEVVFNSPKMSKTAFNDYIPCLNITKISGKTDLTNKVLIKNMLLPETWTVSEVKANQMITKIYVDTLKESDFQ